MYTGEQNGVSNASVNCCETLSKEVRIKMLAEVMCKFCTEQKLTMNDIQSAFDIVYEKYYADATI